MGGIGRHAPVAAHLGPVAHTAQEAVGDPGSAPAAAGDLGRAFGLDFNIQYSRRAHDDPLHLGLGVKIEPVQHAEARAQRGGNHAGAGGRPHQREAGKVQFDRLGVRPLADDDVDLEILERR